MTLPQHKDGMEERFDAKYPSEKGVSGGMYFVMHYPEEMKAFIRSESALAVKEALSRRDEQLKDRLNDFFASKYKGIDRIDPFYEKGVMECFEDGNYEAKSAIPNQ